MQYPRLACELCIAACRPGVLSMSVATNETGYRFPLLVEGCTACRACRDVCPDYCFEVFKYDTPITIAEVLAGPIKARKEALASRYEHALREGLGWRVADLTADIAAQAARLRIRYALKLPDAFQLAAALVHSCEALVTHDRDFGEARHEVPILGLDER